MMTLIRGWRCRAIAIGAEREPGDTHAYSTPCAASSSTKVAANLCATSIRFACADSGGRRRAPQLFRDRRRRSRHPPARLYAERTELGMLWDELGIQRTHLVGYSMGGRLALHVAARRPERLLSLLTIGAHAGLEEEAREGRRRGDEAMAQRIEQDGLEAFVKYWSGLPLFAGLERRGPSFLAQVRAERMGNTVAGLAGSLRGMGAGVMEPLWSDLGRVSVPSTFVAGQLDHGYVASARRLAAAIPNGRVQVVLRAGHAAHLERPEAFARVL